MSNYIFFFKVTPYLRMILADLLKPSSSSSLYLSLSVSLTFKVKNQWVEMVIFRERKWMKSYNKLVTSVVIVIGLYTR